MSDRQSIAKGQAKIQEIDAAIDAVWNAADQYPSRYKKGALTPEEKKALDVLEKVYDDLLEKKDNLEQDIETKTDQLRQAAAEENQK